MAFQIPGELLRGIINPKVADPVGANIIANRERAKTNLANSKASSLDAESSEATSVPAYFLDIGTAISMDPENRKKFMSGVMKPKYASIPGLNGFIEKVETLDEEQALTALLRMMEKGKEMGMYKGGRDTDADDVDNDRKVYRQTKGGLEVKENLTQKQQDEFVNNQGAKPRWIAGELKKDPTKSKDTQVKATQWVLPDKTIVTSFDGGKTWTDDNTGESHKIPRKGSAKINTTATVATLGMFAAQRQAQDELTEMGEPTEPSQANVANKARTGTGPWSNLRAATDAFVGGIGVDKIWTDGGLFPETQNNRQALRLIKQIGKAALMNSSRGPIWEQQKIEALFPNPDTFWVNPSTEARKFGQIRDALITEKRYNLQALTHSVDPKEANRYRSSNSEIDKLISLIGPKEKAPSGTSATATPSGNPELDSPVVIGDDDAEYDALKSGQLFHGSDGVLRRKP